MIQKVKKHLAVLAAAVALMVPGVVPAVALADSSVSIGGNVCQGTNFNTDNTTTGTSSSCSTDAQGSISNLLRWVVNVFSLIVGAIAVIMIVVGGLKYITSGGDSSKVGSAKNTIIYAIIGLVIVAIAQVIVHWVLSKATTIT